MLFVHTAEVCAELIGCGDDDGFEGRCVSTPIVTRASAAVAVDVIAAFRRMRGLGAASRVPPRSGRYCKGT